LASENHNTSLGNKECEFILLLIGQLRELKAFDFSPDSGGKLGDDDVGVIGFEEVGFGLVS
jgi:hypothetical protein